MKKQICILTKSLKDHDYCVAGIDISTGKWIRLVSSKKGGAFPKALLDENDFKEFDIIEVNLKHHSPYFVQYENWLVDFESKITKTGSLSKGQLFKLYPIDDYEFVFYNNKNELKIDEIKRINHSLEILKVNNLKLDTCLKGDGKHHYKAQFNYKNINYNLALTDPKFRNELIDKIQFNKAIIIVSIPAVPYGENNLFYKFIAKIIL